MMRRLLTTTLLVFVMLAVGASDGRAQARRVKMRIDGYLCGN
ncbi:MAG: hypothetical protein WCD76_10505 [Pyrinomonadaceae bacterium]